MITVFTPTYNRKKTLPRLYDSLCKQNYLDFEWLVIDDGSTDETEELFKIWTRKDSIITIRYERIKNGGKQRAINKALDLANGNIFFIVDSDDKLANDTLQFIHNAFETLPKDNSFIGVAGLKVKFDGSYIKKKPLIDPKIGYVDCTNIERPKYCLESDMAEAFFTNRLIKYRFPVWENEKFTPESVIWDQIALDGYKVRWFNKKIYYCEYLEDGLTKSSWSLLKNNPMGYAMLFNTQLKYITKNRINTILQFISCCCLAREYKYIKECNSPFVWLLLPFGWLLSMRRRKQINKFCP